MILSDIQILHLCKEMKLIEPFVDKSESLFGISHGPTPNGYDIRVGNSYNVLTGHKYIKPGGTNITHHDYEGGLIPDEGVTLNPGRGILLETMETFNFPPNITALIHNKSSWTKLFIMGPNTVIDGGFKGNLTLAYRNVGPWPVCIEKGMGIAHLIFFNSEGEVATPYEGKYQNQKGVTPIKDKK